MMRLELVLNALAIAIVVLPVPAVAGELTPAEISDEIVGRRIVWWQDGGWLTGSLLLAPDGAAEISVEHPQRRGDTGRWALRGTELCTRWGAMRAGTEKCYSIRRGEMGRFITSGGNVFEIREAGV